MPKSDAKTMAMQLKLDCIRTARSLLPRAPRKPMRFQDRRDTSAADVMKLACELYSWISDEEPRPRRKQQRIDEERFKFLLEAAETIIQACGGHSHLDWAALRRRRGMPDPPPKEVPAADIKAGLAARKTAFQLLTKIL
ncbi:MAG TPA: hypothetical protein VH684_19660 [Xanthobacteraceae bacterium]|jgi:hypothetical protein